MSPCVSPCVFGEAHSCGGQLLRAAFSQGASPLSPGRTGPSSADADRSGHADAHALGSTRTLEPGFEHTCRASVGGLAAAVLGHFSALSLLLSGLLLAADVKASHLQLWRLRHFCTDKFQTLRAGFLSNRPVLSQSRASRRSESNSRDARPKCLDHTEKVVPDLTTCP